MPDTPTPLPADPYLWLEEVDGDRAQAWVAAENRRTLSMLETDPRFATLAADALAILQAPDRVPLPVLAGDRVRNFWQDAAHPQGIWRETDLPGFAGQAPAWRTLLDLDRLAAADGVRWVWHGAQVEPVRGERALVALSVAGEDAVRLREYDFAAGDLCADGFDLPTAKQTAAWETPDRLLLARDWGPGSLTASGYPFVVKRLARGEPFLAAAELFRGTPDDVAVDPVALVDGDGNRLTLIRRARSFFTYDWLVLAGDGVLPLALPAKMLLGGLVADRLVLLVNEAWAAPGGVAVAAGSLVALAASALRRGEVPAPELLFAPTPSQAVDAMATTARHLLATITDTVRGAAWRFSPGDDGWQAERLALPDHATVDLATTDRVSDRAFVTVQSFLLPPSLWQADLAAGTLALVKQAPPRFDPAGLATEQCFATAADGTRIPYFIVRAADAPRDGDTPTIMTAYGGFQLSYTPFYLGTRGKLWLERGGAFVLANIRGGGEFGPAWHEAGLGTRRQLVFDDFAAVGEDLARRGFTRPRRLGIYGGSNGGLLMGVSLTQRPDLWHAVAIQIPLLDMLRYEQLSAGASWVGEYGTVADPAVRAFWERVSPYQALRPGAAYPEPFIWTTTRDDRVGPVQARKFAARMAEYGLPYLFWEAAEGGHAAGANLAQAARAQALEIVYFIAKMMD